MNESTQALRDYLECANIYEGNSTKKKTDVIEMIIYGCITEKLNKNGLEDISTKKANLVLNKSNITVKSLPGYGNAELKKKEIKPYIKENHLLRYDWYQIKNSPHRRCLLRIILKIRNKKWYQK